MLVLNGASDDLLDLALEIDQNLRSATDIHTKLGERLAEINVERPPEVGDRIILRNQLCELSPATGTILAVVPPFPGLGLPNEGFLVHFTSPTHTQIYVISDFFVIRTN